MTKLVVIETPELEKLGNEKSQQIRKTFAPMADMVEAIEDDFKAIMSVPKDDIDQDVCDKAKRLRLDIVKIRTKTAANHKEQKAEYLMAGRAIDGIKNILTWAVEPKEKSLKEIENHFLNIENDRLNGIRADRECWLTNSTDIDPETCGIDLRNMDKDVWSAYAQSKKQERADRIQAEEEAEKARVEAEEKRVADEKKIRDENEKLRLDAIETARIAKIESDRLAKIESDRVTAEEKRVVDQAKKDAKIKADADAKVKAAEKKAEDDRIETARLAKIESDKAARAQKKKDDAQAKKDAAIQAELDAAKAKERAIVEAEAEELDRIEQEKEALKKAGDKGAMAAIRKSIADVIDEINSTKFKSKASKQTIKAVEELLNEAWTKL